MRYCLPMIVYSVDSFVNASIILDGMATEDNPLKPKERILIAARDMFLAEGYGSASVRKIAARAKVDPTLVIRHYGSKELLFLDALILDERLIPRTVDFDKHDIGRHIVSHIFMMEPYVKNIYVELMRASGSSSVAERMSAVLQELFEKPVIGMLEGEDKAIRASFIVSMMMGLMDSLWILKDERLTNLSVDQAVEIYGAAIQTVVDIR